MGVVVDPADYEKVAAELEATKALSEATRFDLMKKAFAHTAAYDAAISEYLTARETPEATPAHFPASSPPFTRRCRTSATARTRTRRAPSTARGSEPDEPTVAFARVLQGKELCYNNLLDLEAALAAVKEFAGPACVIIKHNTPCGVALGATVAEAFARARACDPVSAFGGIVALNRPVDDATALELSSLFLECVIAPAYADDARAGLAVKKNLRLLEAPAPRRRRGVVEAPPRGAARAALHPGRPPRHGPGPRAACAARTAR